MTTQYTPTLKLALPVTGELSGTWGDVVNDNITSMVEQAIAGLATINTWTANSHTLTTADGTTSESRCAMLVLTDTGTALTGAATVICPTASKIYIVKNTSGQSATIKTAAGTGIAVPNGETMFVFCDGTNVVQAVTRIASADVDFAKLKGTGAVVVTNILDEDNMASDSATVWLRSSPSRLMLIRKLPQTTTYQRFWLTATPLVAQTWRSLLATTSRLQPLAMQFSPTTVKQSLVRALTCRFTMTARQVRLMVTYLLPMR